MPQSVKFEFSFTQQNTVPYDISFARSPQISFAILILRLVYALANARSSKPGMDAHEPIDPCVLMCNFQPYFQDFSAKIGIFRRMKVIFRPVTSGYIHFWCIQPLRTRLKPIFHPLHVLKKIGRKCPNVQFGHQNNSNLVNNRLRIGHESSLKPSDYAFQDGSTHF